MPVNSGKSASGTAASRELSPCGSSCSTATVAIGKTKPKLIVCELTKFMVTLHRRGVLASFSSS